MERSETMKRRDIQLLAAARQGDPDACCELGRRYLHGADGFPRLQRTAIDYLSAPPVADSPKAALILVEGMTLVDIIVTGHEASLRLAAVSGSRIAQLEIAAWSLIRSGCTGESRAWLQVAASEGNDVAFRALAALDGDASETIAAELLTAHCAQTHADVTRLYAIAAKQAVERGDLLQAVKCLRAIVEVEASLTDDLADLTVSVIRLADKSGRSIDDLNPAWIESSLASASARGERNASYLLGRALCGLATGFLSADRLTLHSNVRQGSALLLRAAHGGVEDAWLDLYRLHAEPRSSVANLPMARVFLEKSANRGHHEAQRVLGALLMSECTDLSKAERAIAWLHQSASAGDRQAAVLLDSLVVRPAGIDAKASAVIDEVNHHDPVLAGLLQLARHFGLTRREALLVNPATGERPWGLVVERNPIIVQPRLAAPRAIPSLSAAALGTLQRVASMFKRLRPEGISASDWQGRAKQMRRALRRHDVDESLFFADIPSSTLEALRGGPKWASRFRRDLVIALEPVDIGLSRAGPILPMHLQDHVVGRRTGRAQRPSRASSASA